MIIVSSLVVGMLSVSGGAFAHQSYYGHHDRGTVKYVIVDSDDVNKHKRKHKHGKDYKMSKYQHRYYDKHSRKYRPIPLRHRIVSHRPKYADHYRDGVIIRLFKSF